MVAPIPHSGPVPTKLTGVTDLVRVDLTGPAQTMLSTLYCKALDAGYSQPILGDTFARQAVDRIDLDWSWLKIDEFWTPLVTVRTALYDIWAEQFLKANPHATVIHLGCGLDARVFRLDPGPDVQWYDVDYPDVIDLRKKVYPSRENYHLVATSATDPSWLDQIPNDRPTLLLAEGISMYLTPQDGAELLQHVVDRFPSGELQIDFYNWVTVRTQKIQRLQRQSGSTLYWAVNSPEDVLKNVNGIRLLDATTFFDAPTFQRTSTVFRAAARAIRPIRPLRGMLQYHRYAFGPLKLN